MILLDTCAFLWLTSQQDALTLNAKKAIGNHAGALFISAISAFEIGVKLHKNLLELPLPPQEWLKQAMLLHGLTELPVDSEIALCSTQLPAIHKDPADRIIIATAYKHDLSIITPDQHISAYPQAKVIW